MLGSKSDYFVRKGEFDEDRRILLSELRQDVISYLNLKGIDNHEYYLVPFDYFVNHPKKYDGATLVKDLHDIKGLDFSAMRHDWVYIVELKNLKGFKYLKEKIKSDIKYGKDIKILGKGNGGYWRSTGLILSTPFFLIYKAFK